MALIGPSSIPNRVFVDEHGVWWREFSEFVSLVPTSNLTQPEGTKRVAVFARVREMEQRSIVEGDYAAENDFVEPRSEPPEDVTLEEMSVGYEARWHGHHKAYIPQCADCRRERHQGLR